MKVLIALAIIILAGFAFIGQAYPNIALLDQQNTGLVKCPSIVQAQNVRIIQSEGDIRTNFIIAEQSQTCTTRYYYLY